VEGETLGEGEGVWTGWPELDEVDDEEERGVWFRGLLQRRQWLGSRRLGLDPRRGGAMEHPRLRTTRAVAAVEATKEAQSISEAGAADVPLDKGDEMRSKVAWGSWNNRKEEKLWVIVGDETMPGGFW